MGEYVEREALMRKIKEIHCADCNSYHGVKCRACWVDDTFGYIESEPAADVVPVRHGRWEWDTEDIYRCSNCAEKSHVKEVMGRPAWEYCPNCGALMRDGD